MCALTRRSFLGNTAALLGSSLLGEVSPAAANNFSEDSAKPHGPIESYSIEFIRLMHAPGMSLGTLAKDKHEVRTFGYSNLGSREPVRAEQPFWIGSIGKSFAALVALQLYDEGKLDLHKPILEIMPDLPLRNSFGAITMHHLLTHTSGLPNWLTLISSDPTQIAEQQYAPGKTFAYCNLAFDTIGFMIAHIDGRSWPDAVTARIFEPLGMTGSSGRIDYELQARMPTGYQYQNRMKANNVTDLLAPAGDVLMSNAAGSIGSTAADMNRYIAMIAAEGVGPGGRILSREAFALFSKPHIHAPIFSPTSSYGYGIGVDTLDGHKVLRHTGGTTNFASAILIDIEAGTGAFASINAMQAYRPTAVVHYAVQVLNAQAKDQPVPPPPHLDDPLAVKNASEYTGAFTAQDGETVSIASDKDGLMATFGATPMRLIPVAPDTFRAEGAAHPANSEGWSLYFEREEPLNATKPPDSKPLPINALSIGPKWYAARSFAGTRSFPIFPHGERYAGAFCNDSPWSGPVRFVTRNGKLWMDGTDALTEIGENHFTAAGEEGTLDLEFFRPFDGRMQIVRIEGDIFRRVAV